MGADAMSRTGIALLALLLALAGTALGYWCGHAAGAQAAEAKHDAKAVHDMSELLASYSALVKQTSVASAALRRAMAEREKTDEVTTQELKDVLANTASTRVDCRHDAGVMRQLEAARERAARAAASGVDGAVPGAASAGGK